MVTFVNKLRENWSAVISKTVPDPGHATLITPNHSGRTFTGGESDIIYKWILEIYKSVSMTLGLNWLLSGCCELWSSFSHFLIISDLTKCLHVLVHSTKTYLLYRVSPRGQVGGCMIQCWSKIMSLIRIIETQESSVTLEYDVFQLILSIISFSGH